MLMVSVSLGDHLVNIYGPLHLDLLTLNLKENPEIHVFAVAPSFFSHSLVVITFVNQVIIKALKMLDLLSTHLIHSGIVKVVGLMKVNAAQLLAYHGFTESMVTGPLLIILS